MKIAFVFLLSYLFFTNAIDLAFYDTLVARLRRTSKTVLQYLYKKNSYF